MCRAAATSAFGKCTWRARFTSSLKRLGMSCGEDVRRSDTQRMETGADLPGLPGLSARHPVVPGQAPSNAISALVGCEFSDVRIFCSSDCMERFRQASGLGYLGHLGAQVLSVRCSRAEVLERLSRWPGERRRVWRTGLGRFGVCRSCSSFFPRLCKLRQVVESSAALEAAAQHDARAFCCRPVRACASLCEHAVLLRPSQHLNMRSKDRTSVDA